MDFRSSRAKSFLLELTRSKTFLQRLSMSRVIVELGGFNSTYKTLQIPLSYLYQTLNS